MPCRSLAGKVSRRKEEIATKSGLEGLVISSNNDKSVVSFIKINVDSLNL